MAIKFLHHMIEEMEHPETKKKVFELSHWHYSTEMPYVAIRKHMGFYDTYTEAENKSDIQLVLERYAKD